VADDTYITGLTLEGVLRLGREADDRPLFPFDLQLFAAEDEGRTEEPTEYKKRKAREEGKVAKTPELPAALILLFCFFTIFILGRMMFGNLLAMVEHYLSSVDEVVAADENILFLFKPLLPVLIRLLVPILAVAFIAGLAGNLVQVGFLFSTKPIQPDFQRINPNPARFFQRILFSRQAAVNLAKSIFKIALIGAVAALLIRRDLPDISRTIEMGVLQGFHLIFRLVFRLVMIIGGILLIMSLPDYLFMRWQHIESLKMTRQELKEERKLLEGDPLLRARMRERQRAYARRRMMQEVPTADVVITNPIHYAVALKYEAAQMSAPTCVAKGQELVARRIREIAETHDVPLYENKPLARELYRRVDIGDEVPNDLFTVVAEILAFVYKLKKKEAV
jgi:flagellar biosynthetic protein FlhB